MVKLVTTIFPSSTTTNFFYFLVLESGRVIVLERQSQKLQIGGDWEVRKGERGRRINNY